MSTTRQEPAAPPPGLHVGSYRLLTKIGEGGMGVVHLAQAPDGSRVALKVLRPHIIGDDEARERLAREVASLRRVRSPRVAEVIDADPWGETPYVATRYVPGLSLHAHARQEGPIAGSDLRWFAASLAEAVVAVHSVGVLHRDIKPSNVLLEGRSPVLIDFGLARLAEDPRLTVTGWLLGTPGYLAPEILYGEDATTASDVHSWAATVVFAATGRPPFGTGPAMAIMDRVRRGEHDLSDVPAEVLPLVAAGLAPDPADRPTLPTVIADLRPRQRWGRRHEPADASTEPTMPLALAGPGDDDATDLIGAGAPATLVQESLANPPAETVHQPAREPYMQPREPRRHDDATPPPVLGAWRPPPKGAPRVQRGAVLAGLFTVLALGFAAAPYLSLLAVTLVALGLRTYSWTVEAARERTLRRGRRTWYDGPLAAFTSPWYLLVATGGTLMLMVWATALAFLVGVGLLLFRVPTENSLVVMGGVLAFCLWWGPGARRLRAPVRALVLRGTGSTWVGWTSVAFVAGAAAVCATMLVVQGVVWEPLPGPPWREGTLLGRLVSFF